MELTSDWENIKLYALYVFPYFQIDESHMEKWGVFSDNSFRRESAKRQQKYDNFQCSPMLDRSFPFQEELRGCRDAFDCIFGYLDKPTIYICRSVCYKWRVAIAEVDQPKKLCKWAARHSYFGLLQWAHELHHPIDDEKIAVYAAAANDRRTIEWLIEHGCPLGSYAIYIATDAGHLDLLRFLVEAVDSSLSHAVISVGAAQRGRLDILEWVHEKKYPITKGACFRAAMAGRLDVMQWLHAKKYDIYDHAITRITLSGNEAVLKWIYQSGLENEYNLFRGAICSNNLATVQEWFKLIKMHQLSHQDQFTMMCTAVSQGNVAILSWMHQQGFNLHGRFQRVAAKTGHLDVLKWLCRKGPILYQEIEYAAARGGQEHILTWLRETNASIVPSRSGLLGAVCGGRFQIVKWIISLGVPLDTGQSLFVKAVKTQNVELIEWLYKEGHYTLNEKVFAAASKYVDNQCRIPALQWLYKKGCPYDETACYAAVRHGNLKALKWLRRNGCPWGASICAIANTVDDRSIINYTRRGGCPCGECPKTPLPLKDTDYTVRKLAQNLVNKY